ncbi:GspE/PulE family protein [Alteromonas sp. A079]|uniref:GspE/PulE family protein n=1 Tax=Alteromonas sp. A079 TaxID=3410268 RepID=UPI003B9DF293
MGIRNDAVHLLFEQYKLTYDKDNELTSLSSEASITNLWDKITHESHISSQELCTRLSSLFNIQAYLGDIHPPDKLLKKVPTKTLLRFHIAVKGIENDEPVIATANPIDAELLDALSFIFGTHYQLVIADPHAITRAIEFSKQGSDTPSLRKSSVSLDSANESGLSDDSIPSLAKTLMKESVIQRASDMHLQPFLNGSVVRIRVDGLLKRLTLVSNSVADGLIRHIKAKAEMDTTAKMLPQDGRMLVELEGREYDLRISTLPVADGKEKLVIRFLNRQSVYALSEIGFSLDEVHTVRRLAAKPSGVILVCGPTGSGKTTTLYSILNTLNDETVSIMTVENPVEYQMQGLSQTEVNEKAGMTFARALRAILRQDPDVLLIGEIRDEETAQIAMQSALTGHLVLSTLHTNDSLSSIPRLLDLGVNPIILAESLAGIMSQRLLRKLCDDCKCKVQEDTPLSHAFKALTHVSQAYKAVGCEKCEFTGYKGRTVVAEIIEISQQQRELLLGGEQDISKFKAAMRGNFNSLSMSASRLIISGITTAAEAYRVIGQQFWYALADEYGNELPDLSTLYEESDQKNTNQNTVLIAGSQCEKTHALNLALTSSWLKVLLVGSPKAANETLHANDNIELVVLEVDEDLSDEGVIDFVARYRREIAWARIPALIRLPANKAHWKAILIKEGATSKFVSKDEDVTKTVHTIQAAISHNADFRWGINANDDQ